MAARRRWRPTLGGCGRKTGCEPRERTVRVRECALEHLGNAQRFGRVALEVCGSPAGAERRGDRDDARPAEGQLGEERPGGDVRVPEQRPPDEADRSVAVREQPERAGVAVKEVERVATFSAKAQP